MQRVKVLEINQFSGPGPLSHINYSIMMGTEAICKETILSPLNLYCELQITWMVVAERKQKQWDVPQWKKINLIFCVHEIGRLQFKLLNSKQPNFWYWE